MPNGPNDKVIVRPVIVNKQAIISYSYLIGFYIDQALKVMLHIGDYLIINFLENPLSYIFRQFSEKVPG